MSKIIAQSLNINGGTGVTTIRGPLVGINNINDVVNIVLKFAYPMAGVVLLLVLIWGGYDFLMSQGDPEKVKSGRAKISAGVIGFVLLMLSYLLVRVIGFIFGVGEGLF